MGPGAYTQQPQSEPRGIVPLQPLNDRNDRANQIRLHDKEVHDYEEMLLPSLDPVKPHVGAFVYHEDVEVRAPHPSDAELFPEQVKFYDVKIEAVKERVATGVPHFGGRAGRGLVEFLRYQDDVNMLRSYLKR